MVWLFGGGVLFHDLLLGGAVNRLEIALVPILLGGGIPLLPASGHRQALTLRSARSYPSGIQLLDYAVAPPAGKQSAD